MGKWGSFWRYAALALVLSATACHRSEESRQLSALDDALKTGVITKKEYDAKKAAIGQLAALDKARDAGLLTPAEYRERKQRLTAVIPMPASTDAAAVTPVSTPPTPASAASTPAAAPLSNSTRPEHIVDQHLNMNAFDVTVPANWKFDGIYVPGSSCVEIPFPVFRMYSPEGLSEIRRMPRMDWRWSDSRFQPASKPDCLDLKRELSADEFLKYFMGMTEVALVRDFPIPQEARDALQKNFDRTNEAMAASAKQMGQLNGSPASMKTQPKPQPATQKGGLAAAIAEYRNGTFTIQERIVVKVMCMHSPINFGPDTGKSTDSCNASIQVIRAPKGQLEGLIALAESQHLGARENFDWISKYMDYQRARWKAMSDQMTANANARMRAQHDEFERGQAVRAQQHQQFMATMQEGTDRSMARAQQAANSRHAIAQDWCDYALDRQTVTGPGGTVKVSNAYGQTWTDGSGNYYQTNDPNANPNGVFRGSWTQTTQVHGDGTAK